MSNSITGVGKLFSGVTSAVKDTVAALNDCGEAWKVQLNAERSLEVAARNNPYLNGQSVKGLKDFAGQLQSVSNYGDEQLLPLMAQLASAGRTQAEIMDIMSAAVDVAASGSMSLDAAVKGLNQTYSGTAGTMGKTLPALKNLTEEQLKNGEAVRLVAKAYKGQAESVADSSVQMKNAWGDLKEVIGAGWTDLLRPAQQALTGFFGDMASKLRENYDHAKALKDAFKEVKNIQSSGALSAGADDYDRLKRQMQTLKDGLKVAEQEAAEAQSKGNIAKYKIRSGDAEKIRAEIQELTPLLNVARESHTKAELAARASASAAAIEADKAKAAAEAQKARADQEAKDSETRARLRSSYEESIRQVEKEYEVRRQLGELVSQEEEDRAVYKASYEGYINLLKNADGLISGNYETEVKYRERIAGLAKKIAEYDGAKGAAGADAKKRLDELKKSIEEINREFKDDSPAKKESERIKELRDGLEEMYASLKDMEDVPPEKLGEATDAYAAAAEKLDRAYARAVEQEAAATREAVRDAAEKVHAAGGFTEKEEKSRTPKQDAVRQRGEAMQAEMEALTQSVEWEQYTADQKKEIWDSYYRDLAQMSDEMYEAWNQDTIDSMASVAETVSGAVSKISSALQSAGEGAIKRAEEQKDRELSIWEEKYRAGEISEEQYQAKKAELEKDAAKKEYQIKSWQWAAQVAEATANIAVGVTKALAQNGWPAGAVMAAMAGAAGAIQLASVVSNKPQPPAFEKGGIVPGSSYSGDRVLMRANSGEGVFTRGQMRALGLMARGEDRRREGGAQVNVENNASNLVGVSPQVDGNRIRLLIDARVNESMKKGRFNGALSQASEGMSGKFYGV